MVVVLVTKFPSLCAWYFSAKNFREGHGFIISTKICEFSRKIMVYKEGNDLSQVVKCNYNRKGLLLKLNNSISNMKVSNYNRTIMITETN